MSTPNFLDLITPWREWRVESGDDAVLNVLCTLYSVLWRMIQKIRESFCSPTSNTLTSFTGDYSDVTSYHNNRRRQ